MHESYAREHGVMKYWSCQPTYEAKSFWSINVFIILEGVRFSVLFKKTSTQAQLLFMKPSHFENA